MTCGSLALWWPGLSRDEPLSDPPGPEQVRPLLEEWGRIWGLPGLLHDVDVTFSARLKRSLGRCRPATGRIVLAEKLRSGSPELLTEVLCHEAAHVAAYRLYGDRVDPHGPEWRRLVREAGFTPRVRAPAEPSRSSSAGRCGSRPAAARPDSGVRYEHRCPVCQAVRVARRKVMSWGCSECISLGLPGRLIITQVRRENHGAPTGD